RWSRSCQLVAVLVEEPVEPLCIIGQAASVQPYPGALPELSLEHVGVAFDRPVCGPSGSLAPPDPVQEYSEPPIGYPVTEEQAARLTQLREDLNRHNILGRAPAEVIDVVVFGDHEVAFPAVARCEVIDRAVYPDDHRARQLTIVGDKRKFGIFVRR